MSSKSFQQGDRRNQKEDTFVPDKQEYTHKETKKREYTRVQLDFSSDALEMLDQLKEGVGANTRAEVIRLALRLLDWFASEILLP
jgi:hypothetical protein